MMESDEHNNLSPSSSSTNNLCGGGECGVVGGCCSIGNKSPLNYMPFVVKQGSGMWCFADAVEFWWARVFGFFLPCFSPLFGLYERPGAVMLPPPWKNVLFEREGLPSEEPVTVRGIWNAKNIWHTCTFKWLRYLDDSKDELGLHEVNQKDQIDGENTALGIIAALVSGICFGMLSLGSDGGEGTLGAYGEFAFVVLYSIAACNTLLASVFSVFIYLAVHETYDDDQAEYFLNLFDSTTFGMGSFAPLVLLESGCVSAALGIVVYLFHYFKLVTAIGATIGVAFGGTFFCQLVMQLTACLYSSHRLNKHILKHQSKRTLSAKDIGSAISTYMADKKVSVEELPDFKTILEYIQTEYKLKVPQNGLETEAKEVLCHKLHHLTEKRVLDFYNKFLEANYYHCVTVDAFVDRIKNFPIMPLSTLERERTIEL